MLSNPRIGLFTAKVPLKTLVIDEASQIALSNYVAPLGAFSSIQKLCFIGDDKQCEFIFILFVNI
jgi:superfamily I DNA and/or RNA helicase